MSGIQHLISVPSHSRPRVHATGLMLAALVSIASGPAIAQRQWTDGGSTPLAPIDQAQESRNLAKLGALSCEELAPQNMPNPSAPVLFGIVDSDWTPDLFGLLRERVQTCTATWPANQKSFIRAQLNNIEPSLLTRAAQKRAGRQATLAQKQDLLARLEAIRSVTPAAQQVQELQNFENYLAGSGLQPAEKAQISAVLMRDRMLAETKLQSEADAKARDDQAKQAEREAKVRQETDAFAQRMTKFSAPVQNFIKRNPPLEKMTREEADAFMTAVYSGVTALRLCGRKFGGFAEELSEMQRRLQVFEAYIREVQGRDEASLKTERDLFGVDTVTARLADMLSANPARLEQACNQGLAYTSSFLDFTR